MNGKTISLSFFIGFTLIVGIFYFGNYMNNPIENNANAKEIKEQEIETSKKEILTPVEKLNLINEYQEKYFKIVKRNDVLLQIEDNPDNKKDMKELKELFFEVKGRITNQNYLNKYNEIEERFSNNSGENTYDMNMFESKHYDAVDSLLNEVYKDVKEEISKEDFNNLKKSEIKWLKDVKDYKSVFDSQDFGTIGTIIYSTYEMNMRSFRTLLLMLYL